MQMPNCACYITYRIARSSKHYYDAGVHQRHRN